MTRRLQLLDAESRPSGWGMSAVIARIRDGLLRDNKVVPAVLGVLALLIFAWLVAGAIMGSLGGEEEEQQASNQASLAQGNDSDSGNTETPAPAVENRDSDASYAGFDCPKDPFRGDLFSDPDPCNEGDERDGNGGGEGNNGGQGGDQDDRDGGGRDGGGANGGRGGNDRGGTRGGGGGDGGDDEDFIEQRSPNDPGSRSTPGGGAGQGGPGQSGAGQAGGGGGLFNSGGDLPAP